MSTDLVSGDINATFSAMDETCTETLEMQMDTKCTDDGYEEGNIIVVIEEICEAMMDFATTKNVELIFGSCTDSLVMSYDRKKIEMIMLNLLSIAIKYNIENGMVKIDISVSGEKLVIVITDASTEISEDKKRLVIEKFEKAMVSGKLEFERKDTGLSQVKSMVGRHGGKVQLYCKVDTGAEFVFEIKM
ncbi:MAG: HAMP domain-containing histidine kinase [Clostridioides sp.]|jgi:cell cycle sensor histidine kinase DivJ|nr:HAMP domain-containing histidine kinase [Clostridioides sp.]